MDQAIHACGGCGKAARVRIHEGYIAGEPVIKHFCFDCADHHYGEGSAEDIVPAHRPSVGSLMIVAGLTIGLISLLGDHLGIRDNAGLSWHKQSGLAAGILLICLGAFWRIDVIGVIGAILIALVFSAKLLHLAGMSGFGWKHQLAFVTGLLLVIAGVIVRQLYYRHLAGRTSTKHTGRLSPSSRGSSGPPG